MKKIFDSDYIKNEFRNIAEALKDNVHLFLLGGGAMSYYDLKTATKDADVVLRHDGRLKPFLISLQKIGYRKLEDENMRRIVYEKEDGFVIDIFKGKISNGMALSEGMCSRSEKMFTRGNLTVSVLSPEDIFILKSITSRKRDRDDMHALFRHGLDFEVIKNEIIYQSKKLDDKAWIAFFLTGIDELKERYGIEIPYYDDFYDLACDEVLKYRILELVRSKNPSIEELIENIDDDEENIRKAVEELVSTGEIEKEGYRLTYSSA